MKKFIIYFFILLQFGCGFKYGFVARIQGYEGPSKPKTEVGRVALFEYGVVSVDGIPCVPSVCESIWSTNSNRLALDLLPGTHIIEVSRGFKPERPLTVNIKPGHVYFLRWESTLNYSGLKVDELNPESQGKMLWIPGLDDLPVYNLQN